ncbi:MAG: PD-(D/E)XK nuclease family protein [Patescibacteria group bacterium]
MGGFYKGKKTWGIFNSTSKEPFTVSRSKIDLFLECPRCFYLDRRLGVSRPPGFPFNLNNAVDELLKKEFDIHRGNQTVHPLAKAYGLKAVPFQHEDLAGWRDALKRGVQTIHTPTNFLVRGGIDDVWKDTDGSLIIVDYKATSKKTEVNLDADWQIGYKRQMEVYQWLFRQNGFSVSDTGYFVYVNAETDKEAFDAKLEFSIKLLPYTGKTDWIEATLYDIKACLTDAMYPKAGAQCDYCPYRELAGGSLRDVHETHKKSAKSA